MIKAIIFDMDDTLICTSELHQKAFEKILINYGINKEDIPKKEYTKFFGMSDRDILIEIAKIMNKKLDIDKVYLEKRAKANEYLREKTIPNVGFEELVSFVKNSKFKFCVGTSSLMEYVDSVNKAVPLKSIFKHIVTRDMIEKAKPAPDIFLKAAEVLDVLPEECVIVEDSMNGVVAGKSAGMYVIGIRTKLVDSHQDLSSADVIINSLADVEKIVKKLNSQTFNIN